MIKNKNKTMPLEYLLEVITEYFKDQRFNKNNHLGLGDIRLTIAQQENILKCIASATKQEFKGM